MFPRPAQSLASSAKEQRWCVALSAHGTRYPSMLYTRIALPVRVVTHPSVQNAALDFSKLQEAMGDGQCLSVSARARLLESPFVQAEPTPSSVQKLAKQFGNIGIAPPKPPAQKALHFGTPSKAAEGADPQTRVALGELPTNHQIKAADSKAAEDDHSFATCVDTSHVEGKRSSVGEIPADLCLDASTHVDADDAQSARAEPVVGALATAPAEETCAEVLGDLVAAVESVEIADRELPEQSNEKAPRLLGHNFDAYVAAFDHDDDAPTDGKSGEETAPISSALEDVEICVPSDAASGDEEVGAANEQTEKQETDEVSTVEMPQAGQGSGEDSDSLAQSGEVIEEGTTDPEAGLVIEQREAIEQSHMNSSVGTAPNSDAIEDADYDAALDDDVASESVHAVLPEVAWTAEAQQPEPSVEVGADARSQAVTVTEMSLEQQGRVLQDVADTQGVADIEEHVALMDSADDPIREASPLPMDPLAQASAPSHSSSPVSLPKKRNSSPMEEHLKQVVKTSVVDFCSEVQEENIYLSEKVEKLEKHVEKFSMLEKELAETKMQLARTTSQLNDCATRQQMSDLLSQHAATQELLREQIALRDQGQASCRGCTIC